MNPGDECKGGVSIYASKCSSGKAAVLASNTNILLTMAIPIRWHDKMLHSKTHPLLRTCNLFVADLRQFW